MTLAFMAAILYDVLIAATKFILIYLQSTPVRECGCSFKIVRQVYLLTDINYKLNYIIITS